MEIIAKRTMNFSYPILDSIFLVFLVAVLIMQKKYRALIWGTGGALLYFFVDYVLFNIVAQSRFIEGASLFWVLLWMSFSYGFTNFVLIWLALEKDEHLFSWAVIIFLWWIACPQISQLFSNASTFTIWRTTAKYHGIMGVILFISYAVLIIYNMRVEKYRRVNILWLLLIGILVQFGWEFSLLVSGIRSENFSAFESIKILIVNSLTETNLGMPTMYLLFILINRKLDIKKAKKLGIDPAVLAKGTTYEKKMV